MNDLDRLEERVRELENDLETEITRLREEFQKEQRHFKEALDCLAHHGRLHPTFSETREGAIEFLNYVADRGYRRRDIADELGYKDETLYEYIFSKKSRPRLEKALFKAMKNWQEREKCMRLKKAIKERNY